MRTAIIYNEINSGQLRRKQINTKYQHVRNKCPHEGKATE